MSWLRNTRPTLPTPDLEALAVSIARIHGLDPGIVCGLIETESKWRVDAKRREWGFYLKYIAGRSDARLGGYFPDGRIAKAKERFLRAHSFGLTQIMLQVARELGFKGEHTDLYDPKINLTYGCRKLKSCFDKHHATWPSLLCFNGGSDIEYPNRVISNSHHY